MNTLSITVLTWLTVIGLALIYIAIQRHRYKDKLFAKILTGSGEWHKIDITDKAKWFIYRDAGYLIERVKVGTEGTIIPKKVIKFVEGIPQAIWFPPSRLRVNNPITATNLGQKLKIVEKMDEQSIDNAKNLPDDFKDKMDVDLDFNIDETINKARESTAMHKGMLIDGFELASVLRAKFADDILATSSESGLGVSKKQAILIVVVIVIAVILMAFYPKIMSFFSENAPISPTG